jgi:hypothetical protein
MGYLISASLMKQCPDSSQLRAALPKSIGFAVYKHLTYQIFAIDTYRATRPSSYPFCTATPATDLSLDVPADLARIYEELRSENAANGLKRSYINLCRLISATTKQEVLSVFADDDGNDFACLCRSGELLDGVAKCQSHVVRFGASSASISPVSDDPRLHQFASEAVSSLFGVSASDLGFGSFDPPENYGFGLVANA